MSDKRAYPLDSNEKVGKNISDHDKFSNNCDTDNNCMFSEHG